MAYEVDPPSIIDLSADRSGRALAPAATAFDDDGLRAQLALLVADHDDLRRRAEGAELQVADLERCLDDAAAVADDAELRAARLAGELATARAEVVALERRVAELMASRGLATPAAAGSSSLPAPVPTSVAADERSLGRALKRVLADEQNELLDRACRSRRLPAPGDLLPDGVGRRRSLAAAAASLGPERAAEVASLLSDALDERLAAVLAAATDADALADAARAVYREWRERRVDAVVAAVVGGRPPVDGAPPAP